MTLPCELSPMEIIHMKCQMFSLKIGEITGNFENCLLGQERKISQVCHLQIV